MSAIWTLPKAPQARFPTLEKEVDVDVAVVGGGITGLSTALRLAEAGRRVAVIEARDIASGSTGGSTGNLYGTFSQSLTAISKKWDKESLKRAVALRSQAVKDIENNVQGLGIDCAFKREPLYFAATEAGSRNDMLDSELELSQVSGLEAEFVDGIPGLAIPLVRALKIENQAQFNPLQYARGLAQALAKQGVPIFENSKVIDIDPAKYQAKTEEGLINAGDFVLASHTPKGINLLQTEMEVSREYGIAAPLAAGQPVPEGVIWLLDNFHSLRTYHFEGRNYLMVIGEKHPTGHHQDGVDHYQNLKSYLRGFYPELEFTHEWSAQQYRAADLFPYIGHSGHDNVYVATGFAADGLTWGEVASRLISDQILGRENASVDLFNPRRFTPVKSAKNWAETNLKVGKHFVADRLSAEKLRSLEDLKIGEGKIAKLDGEKVAVYRGPDSSLTILSPVCPHMKCYVNWNPQDRSWDCPCHGSRFDVNGTVLEGPAYEGLQKIR